MQIRILRPKFTQYQHQLSEFRRRQGKLIKVAIVDDDDAVRDAIGLLLRVNGFAVSSYPSGPALLSGDRLDNFGCLLIDVHMPAMTGIEVLELLRRRNVHTPVILITGRQEQSTMDRIQALQGVTLLQKPVLDQPLMRAIEKALAAAAKGNT